MSRKRGALAPPPTRPITVKVENTENGWVKEEKLPMVTGASVEFSGTTVSFGLDGSISLRTRAQLEVEPVETFMPLYRLSDEPKVRPEARYTFKVVPIE